MQPWVANGHEKTSALTPVPPRAPHPRSYCAGRCPYRPNISSSGVDSLKVWRMASPAPPAAVPIRLAFCEHSVARRPACASHVARAESRS